MCISAIIGSDMTIDLRDVPLECGDHVVHFYDREIDLFGVVGHRLARAVRAQELSIVIASAAHRRGFELELEVAGVEVASARQNGRLVMFDAASTMTQFMVEGHTDRAAFGSVLGAILDEVSDEGRPIHVYGEMVALLWEAGDVLAAVELESLWNELIETRAFSLLCAYPSTALAGSEHAEALRQVCRLHSSVVQNAAGFDLARGERTANFEAEPGAPGAARRFVRDALQECGGADEGLVDEAAFVVSELATNAVVHARSAFSVGICVVPAQQLVRLSVRDASPIMSTVGSRRAPAGWGLTLVAGFAKRWGIETSSDAKVVWAELSLPSRHV
jgi:anti-sigma regulatory factor (Ser/Thr protein kinase)